MGLATSIGILAIILTAFFGLGGVSKAEGFLSENKIKIPKFGGNGRSIITKTNGGDEPLETGIGKKGRKVTTSKEEIDKTVTRTPIVKSTVRNFYRRISDVAKLDKRKRRSRSRFLKKSGAEILRTKLRQEVESKDILRARGATFAGLGKFGRSKLFANPNFDVVLPSRATRGERAAVIRAKKLKAARDRAQARKRSREQQLQLKLEGKSSSQLQDIARSKGINVPGSAGLTARQLSRILEATR